MPRKVLFAFLSICMLLIGCQKQVQKQDRLVIGIVQTVEHPTLTKTYQGFIDQITDYNLQLENPIEIIELTIKNGEVLNKDFAKELETKDIDLILAISSQSLYDLYQTKNTVPIIFTAVSDLDSLDTTDSENLTNYILTGVSDMIPVESQIKLSLKILPNLKNIGVIYNPAENLSLCQIELLKKITSKYQINCIYEEVNSAEQAIYAAKNLLGEIDALYIPSDLTVTPAIQDIFTWTDLANKPIISGDERGIDQGALCTAIVDYYKLGQQTGKIAFNGITKVIKLEEYPIEMSNHNKFLINKESAVRLNISIPDELLETTAINSRVTDD